MEAQQFNAGWKDLLDKRHAAPLFVMCLGVWLHAADGLMVSTIMPDIIRDIGGAAFVAWSFALYEIGSILAGASCALISLKYGLRASMVGAALLYMTGCLISAVAPDMMILLSGRLMQGLGGGGLIALALVAASRMFSRELLPRAMAAISMIWGTSAFCGPLVGGVFSELGYWRGGFYFFAVQAIGLVALILIVLRKMDHRETSLASGNVPLLRLGLLCAGVVAIASAGINVSLVTSPAFVLLGVFLIILFLRLDGNSGDRRLLPYEPIALRDGAGAALTMVFCFTVSTIAFSIYGPLLMVAIYGASALVAGIILSHSSVGWTILALLVSGSTEKNDRRMIAIGMILLGLSVTGFMVVLPDGNLWLIAFFAFLEGAGFGMSWAFILRRATAIVEGGEKDRVVAALPTVQRAGYAFGAAYLGIVANATGITDAMTVIEAQNVAFWQFAALLPVVVLGLLAMIGFYRTSA